VSEESIQSAGREIHAPAVPGVLPAAGEGVSTAPVIPAPPSLAALLTGHILRDGEGVMLILKPSLWYVPFQSARFSAAVLIGAIAAILWQGRNPMRERYDLEIAGLLIAGRFMWAILQWMGQLYVLTDLRILRLAGIFTVDVFDCPLRKVARARFITPVNEKLMGLGTIEIIPVDDRPSAVWQTVNRPREVREQIIAMINRASQHPLG